MPPTLVVGLAGLSEDDAAARHNLLSLIEPQCNRGITHTLRLQCDIVLRVGPAPQPLEDKLRRKLATFSLARLDRFHKKACKRSVEATERAAGTLAGPRRQYWGAIAQEHQAKAALARNEAQFRRSLNN